MCSEYIFCTHFSLFITLLLHVSSSDPKQSVLISKGREWLFDVSIRRSPTLTRQREDEARRSGRAQSKVFLNGIRLKVIFLVEWTSNCVCLHTQAGCWSLAEKTIRMEICAGLLTGWQKRAKKEGGSEEKLGME